MGRLLPHIQLQTLDFTETLPSQELQEYSSLPTLIRWLQSACFQQIITCPVPHYLMKQLILFDVTRITLPWVTESYKISYRLDSHSNLLKPVHF